MYSRNLLEINLYLEKTEKRFCFILTEMSVLFNGCVIFVSAVRKNEDYLISIFLIVIYNISVNCDEKSCFQKSYFGM